MVNLNLSKYQSITPSPRETLTFSKAEQSPQGWQSSSAEDQGRERGQRFLASPSAKKKNRGEGFEREESSSPAPPLTDLLHFTGHLLPAAASQLAGLLPSGQPPHDHQLPPAGLEPDSHLLSKEVREREGEEEREREGEEEGLSRLVISGQLLTSGRLHRRGSAVATGQLPPASRPELPANSSSRTPDAFLQLAGLNLQPASTPAAPLHLHLTGAPSSSRQLRHERSSSASPHW